MFQQLMTLAGKDDSGSRTELIDQLSDMFLDGAEKHSENEEDLFTDVLTDLINDVDQEAQIRVSNRFADHDNTPRPMARRLAFSEAEVAAPVLERSSVLTEDDLVEVAETQSEDHLMAITRRPELSERLTDAIIDRDMDAPISSAARNLGAKFSDNGYEAMLQKAESGAREISEALSFRNDVPADVADRLMGNLPPAAKVRFLSLMCNDEAEAAEMIRRAASTVETSTRLKRAGHMEASALVAEIDAGKRQAADALVELAEERKVDPVCHILGYMSDLTSKYVQNVIHKPEATAFVILCRAIDLEEPVFRSLFEMRANLLMKRYDFEKAVEDYLLIDKALAVQTLEHLRRKEATSE